MPKNVNAAFDQFMKDQVNLDSSNVTKARSSRDWLLDQIKEFGTDESFPTLCEAYNLHYGSFSRNTKIRPLDDIDLMIGLHGQSGTYLENNKVCDITISASSNLGPYCHPNSMSLNSRKVLEAFKSKLNQVPQYTNADIKRNMEAVTLSLKSYEWVFDLLPTFHTSPDEFGRTYFLIPDGNGYWKKTNPKLDSARSIRINRKHNGRVLNIIRAIKYWNSRPVAPKLSSYLLENFVLDYYERYQGEVSQFVDMEVEGVLKYISEKVVYDYNDPKGIQGNISTISYEDSLKVSKRAAADAEIANEARRFESDGDMKNSILKWQIVFGPNFPEYED